MASKYPGRIRGFHPKYPRPGRNPTDHFPNCSTHRDNVGNSRLNWHHFRPVYLEHLWLRLITDWFWRFPVFHSAMSCVNRSSLRANDLIRIDARPDAAAQDAVAQDAKLVLIHVRNDLSHHSTPRLNSGHQHPSSIRMWVRLAQMAKLFPG